MESQLTPDTLDAIRTQNEELRRLVDSLIIQIDDLERIIKMNLFKETWDVKVSDVPDSVVSGGI